jgi:hypothetical protein
MPWDFTANKTVDSLDVVPEEFKPLYVEDKANQGYSVDPKVAPLADAYMGVNKQLTDAGKAKKSDMEKDAARRHTIKAISDILAEQGLTVDDDLSKLPETIKTKLSELMDQVKGGKQVKVDLDKIRLETEKKISEVKASAETDKTKMFSTLQKYMVGEAAAKALAENGVVEKGIELLLPQIRQFVKVIPEGDEYIVRVVDAAGDARTDGKGGFMGIPDLVKELKTQFPMAFKAQESGGTGKKPGSGTQTTQKKVGTEEKSSAQKIADGLKARGW